MLFQNRTRFPFLGKLAILGVAAVASLCVLLFAPSRVPAQDRPGIPAKRSRLEIAFPFPRPVAPQVNRPDVLELEPAVTQAELILAVRLVDVTETRIVHGGRDVQVTEQYRFEPVRVLKGIFARESLLLTGQDLGIYRFAGGSERLPRGQLMLVILGRQGQNYFNCNLACPTLSQSIPRLEGEGRPAAPGCRGSDRDDSTERPSRAGRAPARCGQERFGASSFTFALGAGPSRTAGRANARRHRSHIATSQEPHRLDARSRGACFGRHAER